MGRLLLYLLAGLLVSSCGRELFTSWPDTAPRAEASAPAVVVKKNTGTITLQVGQGNVATSAAGPKAGGPVTAGEGNQAADSRRGPAVAGNGNAVSPPAPGWPWWQVAGLVLGLRELVAVLWRRFVLQWLSQVG